MTKPISNEFDAAFARLVPTPEVSSSALQAVLDRLSSDDEFRTHLLNDPLQTLAAMGIAVDPALIPAERTLPSKGAVAEDLNALRRRLEYKNSMVIFLLTGNY